MLLFRKYKHLVKYIINKIYSKKKWYNKLEKINAEYRNKKAYINNGSKTKILYAHSFSIFPPCYIHDNLMAMSLEIRGAEIIPVFCDMVQRKECNVYGGVWGGGENFENNCKNCHQQSKKLWKNSNKTIKYSSYLKSNDRGEIRIIIDNLKENEWIEYCDLDYPLGKWAKDILVNNYVVADYRLIENYESIGKTHLENLLLLKRICERIIKDIKPDRVVSNDSFYGMWGIWEILCKKRNIHFYSHWSGGRKNSWCYAYGESAMKLNFKAVWNNFSSNKMSESSRRKVEEWINNRAKGSDMILDTASAAKYKTDNFNLSLIDRNKPTALIASNVIWDLAALNKQIVFNGMIDWISETIEWFRVHSEYQLIIKPHPAEMHPKIPKTHETVEYALKKQNTIFPHNVLCLSSKVKSTVYAMLPLIDVGIVHTTTVGIEMVANGIPVITTGNAPYRGFGFTYDPNSKEDYYLILERILINKYTNRNEMHKEEAIKYILFYFYHYYSNVGIMENIWGKDPVIQINSVQDIMPGKNKNWDYFVDSIIDGLPIISDNRWPPECD